MQKGGEPITHSIITILGLVIAGKRDSMEV
jgi:hypothetical protein